MFLQGYTDNSGLAPILADVLADNSTHARILVLVINQRDDHQMERYFRGGQNGGGMMCDKEYPSTKYDAVFQEIGSIYNKSFAEIGGEYIQGKKEANCVIRLSHTVFFEVCYIAHCIFISQFCC